MADLDPNPMALARGFSEARIVLTAAELDLFTLLIDRPRSADQIARERRLRLRPLTTLLDALTALGLLEKTEARYRCTPASEPLSRTHPASMLPMLLHRANLWHRWSRLTEIVAGPQRAREVEPDTTTSFIGAMQSIARPQAARLVARVKPESARRLLDVGGASGSYTKAFLAAVPGLRATLFDRPEVIELARVRLAEAGCLDRVELVAGDFMCDELPGGHDLALLSAVIHSYSLERNAALYAKVFAALVPGGRIIIRDHVMSEDRTAPVAGAIFAVNMLVNTQAGGTYTLCEITEGLEGAGFERVRLCQASPDMDALVEAYKPSA